MSLTVCPTDNELLRFSQGRLDDEAIDAITAHLDQCDSCLQRLDDLPPGFMEKGFQLAGKTLDDGISDLSNNEQSIIELSGIPDREASDPLFSEKRGVNEFRVESTLPETDFFSVHEAVRIEDDAPFLIRIPIPGLLTSYHHQACFIDDAINARSLSHDNILPVVAAGSWDDHHVYIACAQIEGMALCRLIEKKLELTTIALLKISGQITSALAYAHSRNVLHRGLSPANVMIARRNKSVLVSDFGFVFDGRYQGGLVQPKPVADKFDAPEAARNDSNLVDHRTDIYSFGAIFEELILLTKDLEDDDRTSLRLIATQCQSQSRSRRYQSIKELQNAIANAMSRGA